MWTPLAWTGAAAVSLLALKYFTIPYLWVFLAGATALFVTAAMDRRRRPLWFNVACLGVGLAIFEYYLWSFGPIGFEARRVEAGNYDEFLVDHRQLGWAIQPDSLVTQKLSFEGELLYDAAYTIGPDGLRISSPSTNDDKPSTACALFFVGSFTFGQGLADHQALPFRVHEKSAQRYRTYNFGFPGYGAHQMLSALQHGLVRDAVQCDPTRVSHVFYQGITDHISRSAGPLWWWERGPKMRFDRQWRRPARWSVRGQRRLSGQIAGPDTWDTDIQIHDLSEDHPRQVCEQVRPRSDRSVSGDHRRGAPSGARRLSCRRLSRSPVGRGQRRQPSN
jgi:hypothetical protein